MQDEFSRVVDFAKVVGIVRIVVSELELETSCDATPETRLEATDEGATLFCF